MNRFLSACLVSLCLTGTPLPAQAEPSRQTATDEQTRQEREAFVHQFAQTVVSLLHDPKKRYAERKDMLRNAFSASVDIDWIARFVLGNAWNKASDQEKERYVALYRRYLTESYVANFAENPDKRIRDIKVLGLADAADPSSFTVRTQMLMMGADSLRVSYLVNEKEGRYKVRDIAIENVSLINTHRAQISALAASRGVGEVIARLETAVGQERPAIVLSMK